MSEYQAPPEDILEMCLHMIEAQGWTVEDCLSYYPAHRDGLEPLLKTAEQFRAAQSLSPSPIFREQALPRLRARLKLASQPRPDTSAGKNAPSRTKARPQPFYSRRGFAIGIAGLVAILGLAAITTGTIYAADSALPGEPLYPVEQAVEQVRLGFAPPGKALGLRIDFAEKRLSEAEQLRQKGDDGHMQEALDDYYQLVSDLTQTVSSDDSAADQALLDRMNTRLALHQARLETLLAAAPPAAQAGLSRAVEASKRGQERAAQAMKDHGGGRPERSGGGRPEITSMPVVPDQVTDTSMPPPANPLTDTPLPANAPGPTDVAPTSTLAPTDTPIPIKPPAPSCDNVAMVWNGITGNSARVTITNTNSSPVALTHVTITWPGDGANLKHIKFTGVLWSGDAAPPSFSTGVSGLSTVLDPAKQTSSNIVFQFVSRAPRNGYTITVKVDIGCILTVNN